ncbi:hypothetical protein CTI12_AA363680 [Artemisia annua]|uniref:Uncharacterized protein n=1 Tax=Artemisia annua TaxID=35608 RepID=A0A2U1MML5_ARTAN|nr:hypothetical protein CTI12_AA363680 [Artemisia annua]
MEVVEVQQLQDDASEEVEDVIEDEEELEEVEYESGSEEDNEAKEKDEWQDNFTSETDLTQQEVYQFNIPTFGTGVVFDVDYSVRQEQFRFFTEALRVTKLKGYVDMMVSEALMENEDVDQQLSEEDRRIVLTIEGGSFNPSNNVTSTITSIWKSRFTGTWDTWKIVPKEDKEIWFNSFKLDSHRDTVNCSYKGVWTSALFCAQLLAYSSDHLLNVELIAKFLEKYTWDARINQKVRDLFNYLGSRSLRDFMTRLLAYSSDHLLNVELIAKFLEKYTWDARINQKVRDLFNHLGSRSLRDFMTRVRIKGRAQKPPFMNQAIWEGLWAIWESPDFIAKSERGRAARQSNKRLHVAGSVSIPEHRRRLQKELGRDPTAAELFFRTHVKKDKKTFVDDEAKETWEQYMAKYGAEDSLDKQSGNIANTYIRWAEHVGSKKGKFYGQTSQNHEFVQLREMLDCQKIENDLLKAEQERMKATQEAHSEKLDQIGKSRNLLEDSVKAIQGATQKVLDLLQRRQPAV